MIGKELKHKVFGVGLVSSLGDTYITVIFKQGEKKFAFPDALKTFLIAVDPTVDFEIKSYIAEMQAYVQQQKEELRQQELAIDATRAVAIKTKRSTGKTLNAPKFQKTVMNRIQKGHCGQQYFFVFQNKTYDAERNGGYLWAPKSNDDGRTVSHWKLMKEVSVGDVIFHSVDKNIVAISIACSNCYSATQPEALQKERIWTDDGWRVDCKYISIKYPVVTSDYMDTLLNMQPDKYAPFNNIGRGNTGYLFASNLTMSEFLFSKLTKANPYLKELAAEIGLAVE